MLQDRSRLTRYLSVTLMVIGVILIFLGWNGAASRDFVEGQLPYVISGGISGLVLVGAGLTLALVQQLRRTTGRLESKLEWLAETIAARDRAGPTAVPESGPLVVAGASSYHTTDCHLVADRDDLQAMSPAAAVDRELTPCRICEPHEHGSAAL